MIGKIVGTQFAQAKAKGIETGSVLNIMHDKENKFNTNALAVYLEDERLGYIGEADEIFKLDRDQFPIQAEVLDFMIKTEEETKFKKHEVGTLVSCSFEIKEIGGLKMSNNIKSFNEEGVIINFDEEPHTYTYNDVVLTGATTFIKKYIVPFESSTMINNCARSWDLPKTLIQKAWELNRDATSTFGTGIHKALQFEDLYRAYYKKSGDRCFTIKHPVLSKIVSDFFLFHESLGFKGTVFPEALISDVENQSCALADRILVTDNKNKICRLQDYKVNHSFDSSGKVNFRNLPEEINLPTSKLSKLSLQLKEQARMLEKSGWTVEAFDGFVFSDKWYHYEADTLEGFNILEGTFSK